MPLIEIAQEDWINEYAMRILSMWQDQQGPLGQVSKEYIEQLKEDLAEYFEEPLKKELIEATF